MKDKLDIKYSVTLTQRWAALKEARDYLHQWLHDDTYREHPIYGDIELGMGDYCVQTADGIRVCVAGLWYLRKRDRLLVGECKHITKVDGYILTLLDSLRWYLADYTEDELVMEVPCGTRDELVGGIWDDQNPHHILLFMDWLLEQQHDTPTTDTHE